MLLVLLVPLLLLLLERGELGQEGEDERAYAACSMPASSFGSVSAGGEEGARTY